MTTVQAPPAPSTKAPSQSLRQRVSTVNHAYLVLAITVGLLILGTLTADNFLSRGNLTSILSLSAAFGIMAVGQAIVVMGKGIDLSVAGVGLAGSQATLALMKDGMNQWEAIGLLLLVAVVIGVINGVLVAFVEVPALMATLATGMIALGAITMLLFTENLYTVPAGSVFEWLNGTMFGVPRSVYIAGLVFLVAWFFISFTTPGALVRAMGDNPDTARASGAPVRPLVVMTYVISAVLALLAGYVAVAVQGSAQTVTQSFAPILFTALTVVVIGGVSLSGGRGTIFGVLCGALLVGVLDNLLTKFGLADAIKDLVRGGVLIAAIAFDAWLHPRNEETEKSGEL
ncbi:ABC transporter permease [Gordonia sp. (in: high G+C Gram-positive bacteria)]|uniref:ABC transporter permease n=1 Tax=Gordonia sp. (in: high G+C Gram-positive bacteria) TaxID=84139 RepID=UPI0039E68E6F